MNAGFSNLTALKAQLLAASLRTRTDWDTQIRALGLGVAAAINAHCNREFSREEGGFYVTSGGRLSLILPRYPVETITAIETRDSAASDWVDELASLDYSENLSGLVKFETPLGDGGQIRVTYTGGYFGETLDSTDDGSPTAVPEGAASIPDNVLTAWHLQCEALWRAKDKLGTMIKDEPDSQGGTAALTNIELIPMVKAMLAPFVRYALT